MDLIVLLIAIIGMVRNPSSQNYIEPFISQAWISIPYRFLLIKVIYGIPHAMALCRYLFYISTTHAMGYSNTLTIGHCIMSWFERLGTILSVVHTWFKNYKIRANFKMIGIVELDLLQHSIRMHYQIGRTCKYRWLNSMEDGGQWKGTDS